MWAVCRSNRVKRPAWNICANRPRLQMRNGWKNWTITCYYFILKINDYFFFIYWWTVGGKGKYVFFSSYVYNKYIKKKYTGINDGIYQFWSLIFAHIICKEHAQKISLRVFVSRHWLNLCYCFPLRISLLVLAAATNSAIWFHW